MGSWQLPSVLFTGCMPSLMREWLEFNILLDSKSCKNLDITFVCWKNGGIPHEVPMPNSAHTLVSACHKHRSILSHRLTTCCGLHKKMSLVSIQPRSSAHTGDSSKQRPALPSQSSIRSFTWLGLETSSWSSSRSLDRPTPQWHWICSCQPLETCHSTGPWWSDATDRAGCAMTTMIYCTEY